MGPTGVRHVQSIHESLCQRSGDILQLVNELLRTHSAIQPSRMDSDGRVLCFFGPSWAPLTDEGLTLRSRAYQQYDRFFGILYALLRDQPSPTRESLQEADQIIRGAINQDQGPHHENLEEILADVATALTGQLNLLRVLIGTSPGPAAYVPDTNALLFNPDLEDWSLPDVTRFRLVLLPTVVRELDRLKVEHRNPDLRQKAEGLIRRIKGYRQRGSLTEGVPLKRPVSTLISIAVEPNMKDSLPWLDPTNDDDRILAGFLEVVRRFIDCPVILLTRDLNLQNKAEFAGLPFAEPPEPSKATGISIQP